MTDTKCLLESLRRQLRALKFNRKLNYHGMVLGEPQAFVEFYRLLLCEFNTELSKNLLEKGFSLMGTTDFRFMEVLYRILRDLLNVKSPITLAQFFSNGFADRKLEMATSIATQVASLISPTVRRQRRRQSHLPKRTRSANMSRCAYWYPLPGRTHSANGRIVQTKQSLTNHAPSSFSRFRPQDSLDEMGPSPDKPVQPALATTGDEPDKEPHPSDDYYDQLWEEKTVNRPPTFMHVDSYPTIVWGEESHNQAMIRRPSETRSQLPKKCTGTGSVVFSATLPNVAQSNQTPQPCPTGGRSSTANFPYAKYRNHYHPLNSNPRPCSYSSLRRVNVQESHTRVNSATAHSQPNVCITSVPCKSSNSIACMPSPVLTKKDTNPIAANEQNVAMREILRTLCQLNGKVDNLIVRLSTLETRLSNTEIGLTHHCPKDSHDHLERTNIWLENEAHKSATTTRDFSKWNRTPVLQSESSHQASAIQHQITRSSTNELKSSGPETSEPGQSILSSRCHTDEKQTTTVAHSQLRFSTPLSVDRSIYGASSLFSHNSPSKRNRLPSPPMSISMAPQGETRPTSSQSEALKRSSSSTWNVRRFGDYLKSPAKESCERVMWPPVKSSSSRELPYHSSTNQSKPIEASSGSTQSTFVEHRDPPPGKVSSLMPLNNVPRPSEPYKHGLFGRIESTNLSEPSGSTSLDAQPDDPENSTKLGQSDALDATTTPPSEPYHAQVDRITAMLAETQGLLETRRLNLVNGTA